MLQLIMENVWKKQGIRHACNVCRWKQEGSGDNIYIVALKGKWLPKRTEGQLIKQGIYLKKRGRR